jgi:hypothetical protein
VRLRSWKLLDKRSGKKAWAIHGKSKLAETEKDEIGEDKKSKSMLLIFFDIKGIVLKEFVLAGQPVNSSYYCDILRRLSECEDFPRTIATKTGCCITTKHSLTRHLLPGNFWAKETWLSSSTHHKFLCFLHWREKWPSFWHNWGDRRWIEIGA